MDSLRIDRPELSVIIPVSGDARTLRQMLKNLKGMAKSREIIVVIPAGISVCFPQDYSPWIRVIPSESYRTYDQGRAIGAYHADGQIILFLDERVVLAPVLLQKYVAAIENGADIALTISDRTAKRKSLEAPEHAYRLLNQLLGRVDLGTGTMSKIPYACSRHALELLGYDSFSTPPVAFTKAVRENLTIQAITPFPPIQRLRTFHSTMTKDARHILYDHAQAFRIINEWLGERGGLPDGNRYRGLLKVPGKLHLRSVFYQQPRIGKGGKRGGKGQEKQTTVRKKKGKDFTP